MPLSTENTKLLVLYGLEERYFQVSQVHAPPAVAPPQVETLISFGAPKISLTSVEDIPILSLSIFSSLKAEVIAQLTTNPNNGKRDKKGLLK
ncbi:hypothetical protein ICN18_02535 [Polynucleobacter sp. Ross1-W9]|uniref:hypothetical protein n=1 Tax=Polynucleobacter parvulilacunae TaxID=1855631 RepID=UPI001C0C086A|nr:hypothetical protein [Polynucleobacter parvulilacunae]MBU3556505.1 hypothetical protein [Polynucleobacter parvulilacunae]